MGDSRPEENGMTGTHLEEAHERGIAAAKRQAARALVEDRTKGLGGTDIAPILGLHNIGRRERLDVYLEKIGEAEPVAETEPMYWGKSLEENVARRWVELEGKRVRRVNRDIQPKFAPWLCVHPDRMVVGEKAGLEIKVSSSLGWGEEGTEDVPGDYLVQCHTCMAATGAQVWYVAALLFGFGPPRLARYVIPRNQGMINVILRESEAFWNDHVLPRTPPEPRSSDAANLRWRQAVAGKVFPATEETVALIGELEEIKADQKELKARRELKELELKRQLQDAEGLISETGDPLVTWKTQTSKRLDTSLLRAERPQLAAQYTAESEFRVLRITAAGRKLATQEIDSDD